MQIELLMFDFQNYIYISEGLFEIYQKRGKFVNFLLFATPIQSTKIGAKLTKGRCGGVPKDMYS